MAGWNDLPTELTALILQDLVLQKDVVNALIVCHRFRALLEPTLYKEVSISKPSYEYDCGDEDGTETPPLTSLVRTIAARPELGLLVRSLILGSLGDSEVADGTSEVEVCNTDYTGQQREEMLSSWGERAGDLNVVLSAASQKGLPNGLVLKRGRGKIVFLLHCLPNLSSLSFDCTHGLATIAYAALGRFKGGVPVGLRTVKNLTLSYDDTEMGFRTEDVVPFLALPALAEILVWSFAGEEWEEFFPEIESSPVEDEVDSADKSSNTLILSRSSAITHLYFEHSAVDCAILNRILMLPRRLDSFKYDVGGATVGFSDYAPRRFLPGLCTQADSLVELFITDVDNTSDFDEVGSVIGSLTAFTVLTHLRVNTNLLLGRHDGHPATEVIQSPLDALLPPSLVILELELGRDYSLDDFIAITGVPRTLTRTSHQLPALRNYHLGIKGIFAHQRPTSELRQEVARLNSLSEVVSPQGHQILLKAGSPYFYIFDDPIP